MCSIIVKYPVFEPSSNTGVPFEGSSTLTNLTVVDGFLVADHYEMSIDDRGKCCSVARADHPNDHRHMSLVVRTDHPNDLTPTFFARRIT